MSPHVGLTVVVLSQYPSPLWEDIFVSYSILNTSNMIQY